MTVLTGGFKLGDSSATFDNYESINALSYNIYIQMEKIKKQKKDDVMALILIIYGFHGYAALF